MNFLNKARKKAEAIANELQAQAQNLHQQQQQQTGYPQQQYGAPQIQQQQHGGQQHGQYQHGYPQSQPQPQPQHYYPPPPQPSGVQSYQPHQQIAPPPQQGYHHTTPAQQNFYPPPPQSQITQTTRETPAQQNFYPPQPQPQTQPTRETPAQPQNAHHAPGYISPQQQPQVYGYQAQLPPPPPPQTYTTQFPPPPSSQQQQQHGYAPAPPNTGNGALQATKCIGENAVLTAYVDFYVLSPSLGVAPGALGLCYACFASGIAPHRDLAANFTVHKSLGAEERFMCDWGNFPRIAQLFNSECVPTNKIQPLLDFAHFYSKLTPCTGSVIEDLEPFYVPKGGKIPDFAVCSYCYELFLHNSPFDRDFERRVLREPSPWMCDIANPYFRRTLVVELQKSPPSFDSYVSECAVRQQAPACTGEGQPISALVDGRCVVMGNNGKSGRFCISCYCDNIAHTSLDGTFSGATPNEEEVSTIFCDLATPYSKSALEVAVRNVDYELWLEVVGLRGKVGNCRGKKGVNEEDLAQEVATQDKYAEWYHIKDYPAVEICPSCYWLILKLYGGADICTPISRPLVAGMARMCFFTSMSVNPTESDIYSLTVDHFEDSLRWRSWRLRNALTVLHKTGDAKRIFEICKTISAEPPPCGGDARGFKRPTRRKWFGRLAPLNDPRDCSVLMCEECYTRCVKDTPLMAEFGTDYTEECYVEEGDVGFVCQPYSTRARDELRAACLKGDKYQFADYWNNRQQLKKNRERWADILRAQAQRQMLENSQTSMNMMLKINAQSNALMLKGGAGIAEAAMSDTGVRYGNDSVSAILHPSCNPSLHPCI